MFYHVDGDVFDGEWYEDKAHGFGTYFNVNGSKYEGYWSDDLQDGEGKETWKDGSVYEGMYRLDTIGHNLNRYYLISDNRQ